MYVFCMQNITKLFIFDHQKYEIYCTILNDKALCDFGGKGGRMLSEES